MLCTYLTNVLPLLGQNVICEWLGDVTVRTLDFDQAVVGSTAGQVAIKWLLLGWMTVCGQVNHLGI